MPFGDADASVDQAIDERRGTSSDGVGRIGTTNDPPHGWRIRIEQAGRDSGQLLAWDLADAATPLLDPGTKSVLFVKLGAGDSRAVIVHLLCAMAARGQTAPTELSARLSAWVDGYAGSDGEHDLRQILKRVTTSSSTPHSQHA